MKTDTSYTPGPWHVGMKPGPIVYGPQGEQVANMHVAMLDQEEHKANARLIASAPELLEMLEQLTLHVMHYASMPHAHSDAHKNAANARALIKKVTCDK